MESERVAAATAGPGGCRSGGAVLPSHNHAAACPAVDIRRPNITYYVGQCVVAAGRTPLINTGPANVMSSVPTASMKLREQSAHDMICLHIIIYVDIPPIIEKVLAKLPVKV